MLGSNLPKTRVQLIQLSQRRIIRLFLIFFTSMLFLLAYNMYVASTALTPSEALQCSANNSTICSTPEANDIVCEKENKECAFKLRKRNAAALVCIAIIAGFIGGSANYFRFRQQDNKGHLRVRQRTRDDEPVNLAGTLSTKMEKHQQSHSDDRLSLEDEMALLSYEYKVDAVSTISLGIIASLLVPLFLHLIGSNITEKSMEDPLYLVVFSGFCLIAALYANKFVNQVAEKALAKANQTDEKMDDLEDQLKRELKRKSDELDSMTTDFKKMDTQLKKSISQSDNINYSYSYANQAKSSIHQYEILSTRRAQGELEDTDLNKHLLDAIQNAEKSNEHYENSRAHGLISNASRRLANLAQNPAEKEMHLKRALKHAIEGSRPELSSKSNEAFNDCLYNAVCYSALLSQPADETLKLIDHIVERCVEWKSMLKDFLKDPDITDSQEHAIIKSDIENRLS